MYDPTVYTADSRLPQGSNGLTQELHGAKQFYERAARVADIYKKRADKLNELYEKEDRLLGTYRTVPAYQP